MYYVKYVGICNQVNTISAKRIPTRERLRATFREAEGITHFCSIYRSKREQFVTVVPFIRFGLERHEKCLYIVDDRTKKEVIEAFRRVGVELDPYLATNQLEFLTKKETYLLQGYFSPSKMINLLRNAEQCQWLRTGMMRGKVKMPPSNRNTYFSYY